MPPTGPLGDLADEPGTAAALDLSTGSQRWSLADRYPQSDFALTTPEVALVRSLEDAGYSLHLVEVSDGATVADLEPNAAGSCVANGQDLIACSIEGSTGGPLSFEVGDEEAQIWPEADSSSSLTHAFGGYLFARTASVDGSFAVDRYGSVLSDPLPGVPVPGHRRVRSSPDLYRSHVLRRAPGHRLSPRP